MSPFFLHYMVFHHFIVLASELSNARISGFARAFINNSISTSSETDKSKCISCMRCVSICPVHSY
ncbi:hypothetical protein DWZ50_11995 [Mediterraneibacter gnavus]|uniref:4Fe-4S ferredoxin-type domain-containing protein n=1 Tax=Mediterraneibacter gnavus TaxID=33038 RepID=A0A415S880_MEDGN|nr:hypothetical protein DWZ50_11995 [Mediterraneibacter gnavus]